MNWWVRSTKRFVQNLNYIEHFLVFASAVTGYVSISDFVCLFGIPSGIRTSAIGLKIYAITAGIKMFKSIIKERNMIT